MGERVQVGPEMELRSEPSRGRERWRRLRFHGSSADGERRVTGSLLGVLECRVGVEQQKRIVFVRARRWETRVGKLTILSSTGEGDGRLERVVESISNHSRYAVKITHFITQRTYAR